MKYINIPKSSDTTIDLAAITGNYSLYRRYGCWKNFILFRY